MKNDGFVEKRIDLIDVDFVDYEDEDFVEVFEKVIKEGYGGIIVVVFSGYLFVVIDVEDYKIPYVKMDIQKVFGYVKEKGI